MSEQSLILNIIPFQPPIHEKEFAFYTKKVEGFCPIHIEDLQGLIEELVDAQELDFEQWLYTDFQEPREDAIVISVKLQESIHFAAHYYRYLIREYFQGIADAMRPSFTNEIEVWNRIKSDELIVGIGAFYSITRKTRYVGSAFCFKNEGVFEGFDCITADDPMMLAGSIRVAVSKYVVDHYTTKRLIIHFYKDISKKEIQPIVDTLYTLGLSIPVFVVTINKTESKELLAFDTKNQNLMPYSGTILKVGKKEYLLFNNTRYNPTSQVTAKEYHFPVKVSFASTKPELLEDENLITELMDQVYQFSRMYWKSVSQQNLPVTIKYPEMVAQIYPHFENNTLPEFARKNLWFL